MTKLSVVIITYNEERNLARCLESVREIADEVVIADSNSTDKTLEIAKQYNAAVFQKAFIGYGQQKNFATKQASNDWVLSLDADEALTPELLNSIREWKQREPGFIVYQFARITNYCGKWIRHCGWYPDKQTRLYNRIKGAWIEREVHEYWQAEDQAQKKGLLKGDLLHYSFTTISEHVKKIEKYSELAARDAVARGKSASLLKVLVSPQWHFFSEFFLKLGFLDGYCGYIICRLSAYAALIKYSKIRQYSNSAK